MGTDMRTSESLKGLYGAKPTRKILSTQLTINISKEEMNMMISEHSVGFYSLLSHGLSRCLRLVLWSGTVLPSMHLAAQEGALVLILKEVATTRRSSCPCPG